MKPIVERAVEKVRIYTEKLNNASCNVNGNTLTVEFGEFPTAVDITNLKKLVHFSKSINPNFFIFNEENKKLTIDFNYYEEFLHSGTTETEENDSEILHTVINRVADYTHDMKTEIEFSNHELHVKFKETPDFEVIATIRSMVFYDLAIPSIENVFFFNLEKNELTINLKHYEMFILLWKKLKENNHVVMVYFKKNSLEYSCIHYHTRNISYNELEELQDIVNPEIKYHDSIRVVYRAGISVVLVDLDKKKTQLD